MLLGQAVQLAAQKADWKVGIQTWTFHNLTLMETLDKTQQLGMGYAEAFFFQELGAPFPKETSSGKRLYLCSYTLRMC